MFALELELVDSIVCILGYAQPPSSLCNIPNLVYLATLSAFRTRRVQLFR
jgi:hypothetical protein